MNQEREKWLEDTEKAFNHVKSYNTTIITIGYATFFAVLLFLKDKVDNSLTKYSLIFIVISAAIFASYELMNSIKSAVEWSKHGKEGKRFFRLWASFFIPSLILAAIAVVLIIVNLLCYL